MTTPEVRTCPKHDLPLELTARADPRLSKSNGQSLVWRCPAGHEVTVARPV